MAVDLNIAKAHLNVTFDTDDVMITRLISAAGAYLEAQLGFAIGDVAEFPEGTPPDLENAQLMLISHWYENREAVVVGVAAQSVPFGIRDIVSEYRNYTFAVVEDAQ